jgi:hypothetical protein
MRKDGDIQVFGFLAKPCCFNGNCDSPVGARLIYASTVRTVLLARPGPHSLGYISPRINPGNYGVFR